MSEDSLSTCRRIFLAGRRMSSGSAVSSVSPVK